MVNINFALLYKHTFAQLVILSLIQASFFILLVVSKPFVMKISFYISIAFEIFINIAVGCAFILYFLDQYNNLNIYLRMILGIFLNFYIIIFLKKF